MSVRSRLRRVHRRGRHRNLGLVGAAIGAIGSLRSALRQIAGVATDDTLPILVILRNLAVAVGIGVALVGAAIVTFLATAGLTFVRELLGISADSWITRC